MALEKYEAQHASNKLIEYLNTYKKRANNIIEKNRTDFMSALTPGASVPYHIPLNNEYRAQLDTEIKGVRAKFKAEITPLLEKLKKDVAEAPTTEATNTITMLALRSDIDESEISFLMEQYGNNVQCYKAIRDIARKHEINTFLENPTMKQYERLNNLYSKLDSWNTIQAEEMSEGLLSMYEMDINDALATDE